jgi:hypothetical protein
MKQAFWIVALALALAGAAQAQSQDVWRCGSSYSSSPCADGRVVAVADERSAAQRAQAFDVLVRERALAAELLRERVALERETAVVGSGPAVIKASAVPPPAQALRPKASKTKARKPAPAAACTWPSAVRASRSPAG